MIGTTVSHYRIDSKLGEGGMGIVYKATDTQLDRPVALKFLPSQAIATEEDQTRFIREAKAASSLDHPNICTVFEAGKTEDGRAFMAMAYYEGSSLKDVIAKGKMPVEEALNISIQIADALRAADSKGIVHRDVKPGNIMVTPDGVAKLLDFGLAAQEGWAKLTRSHSTVGTAAYMAPEQATGEGADHRSDLWSLGVILYEMLTGNLPFRGDQEAALTYAIVNEEPAKIADDLPGMTPEIAHVVGRLLEKDPDDRYQNAGEVVRELERIMQRSGVTRTLTPAARSFGARAWSRKWGVLAGSIVIVAIVATYALMQTGGGFGLGSYEYTPYMPGELIAFSSFSPDGRSIAYLKLSHHNQEICVSPVGSDQSTTLATINTDWTNTVSLQLVWSPDGSKVYFTDPSSLSTAGRIDLKSVGITGGDPETVVPATVLGVSIAPDGKAILGLTGGMLNPALADSVGLYVLPGDGSPPHRFLNDPVRARSLSPSFPSLVKFSPDGSKICLFYWMGESYHWILPWPERADVEPRRIFSDVKIGFPHNFEWMPDSKRIVLSHQDAIWIGDTEDETLTRITATPKSEVLRSIAPDGKRLIVERQKSGLNIIELPLDGSPYRTVIETSEDEYSPSVSAHGDVLAYVTKRTGRSEIWVEEGASQPRSLVTPEDLGVPDSLLGIRQAVVSPDGKRVAYLWNVSQGSPRVHLWVSLLEGGNHVPLLSDTLAAVSYFCWAPDSKKMFAAIVTQSRRRMNAIIPIGGGSLTELPPTAVSFVIPEWSPDGQWIALAQTRPISPGNQILLISPDGKQTKVLDAPGIPYPWYYALVWSRDSKALYVANSNIDGPRLYAVDISADSFSMIAEYNSIMQFGPPMGMGSNACLSRDGKSLLVTSMIPEVSTFILEGAL